MPETTRVAISLPSELLKSADKERRSTGETRSAFVRRAIRELLAERGRTAEIEQYIEGYRKMPETRDEIELASALASEAFAEDPWE